MEEQFPVIQVMDENGNLVSDEFKEHLTPSFVQSLYEKLILVRTFDRKAISLQRQGRLGTYAPFEGQEAAQVGSAAALKEGDWLFPTYRDHAASITFGHSIPRVFLYWNGRVEGCVAPEGKHIFPPAVPIATQLPHATGAALAEKKKGTDHAAIVYFGDGATSEGDFHEGLNFASVFKAPVVFFNQNNHFAISVPMHKQMNSKTIAQKSVAYGIPGYRIDGNDIFAVYFYTMRALNRARKQEGPTLLEAVTWRYGAHTTADDPKKYRDQEESTLRKAKTDPILRLERYMKNSGLWDDEKAEKIQEDAAEIIEAAVAEMEAFPEPNADDLFDFVFAAPTWTIEDQKEEYMQRLRGEAR
ncbi:pyruvate dehydrogenase (acetyl-transferring) E1 component subunit alpha [Metabacillus sp. GX 13764]|uniref:pyruvate dehydrogenase (acetyl-transferring) E1 component subunit alpha n=1 Tax=Metabacillus kandeliae TaxID=2900151 RepID=UPI001E32FA0B|nr:pyruvate dehydrogenase (acetyl-transferring) E1 component subunit alpha [Metabacillus kandeliae]MCD7036478.1 pyruvate dehydrogenase (acetyl-transferring) E1 component subunit alpha [Metabacillus kandeliae]